MISQLATALKDVSTSEIDSVDYITLAGNKPPWEKTKIKTRSRQAYSLLATGKIFWSSRDLELYGGPGFHLWSRILGGQINNVVHNTGTFLADAFGVVELGIYFGVWSDLSGVLQQHSNSHRALNGKLEVIVISWKENPAAGLKKLISLNESALLKEAYMQLTHPIKTPTGWGYLKETGVSDIYSSIDEAGRPSIALDASDAQGILRKPVDFLVSKSTQLKWGWKLLEHPSLNREDEATD